MELAYRLTAAECRKRRGLAQPGLPDELRGLAWLPGVAATIVMVLALAWLDGSGVIGVGAFALAVAAYALGMAVVPLRSQLLRRLQPCRRGRDVRLTVDSAGVMSDAVHYRWGAFSGVSEHHGFVLLRLGPATAGTLPHLAIPARAFATAQSRGEFVRLAQQGIAARSGSGLPVAAASVPADA